MNHVIKGLVIKTFKTIFSKLSEEMNVEVSRISIGVEYRDNKAIYYVYIDNKKFSEDVPFAQNDIRKVEKIIDIEDYTSMFDVGVAQAKHTIDNKGVTLSNEIGCPVEEIDIIMIANIVENQHQLPKALVRRIDKATNKMSKVRLINVEEEF